MLVFLYGNTGDSWSIVNGGNFHMPKSIVYLALYLNIYICVALYLFAPNLISNFFSFNFQL